MNIRPNFSGALRAPMIFQWKTQKNRYFFWRATRAHSKSAKAPQPPRCTTRSTHGEANSASCATRTTRRAGGHTRGRWTAASSCVSAAPIEEKSSSKLSAHTNRAHTTMSGGEQCGRVLGACARLRERPLPPGRRLEQRRAARHAPQHQPSPLTG